MIKRFFVILFAFFALGLTSFAEEIVVEPTMQELVMTKNIPFSSCVKTYNLPVDKLFYLAILATNANNFQIEELQSKMGYILFKGANKDFLMSVIKVDAKSSMLKITPTDNVYYFPYGIVYNIFKYIDLNTTEELKLLPVTRPTTQFVETVKP